MVNSIQLLRALACLLIVIDHQVVIMELHPAALQGLVDDAAFATDMFFVISGFILWHVTMRREHDPLDLFVRRVIRIVPLYWLLTVVYVAAFIVPPVMDGREPLDLGHIFASFGFVAWEHPIKHYVAPVIIPGHVLNHYMYFYALFAIALALFASPARRFAALAVVILGAAAIGLAVEGSPESEFYVRATIVEFVFGMTIAAVAGRIAPHPRYTAVGLAVLAGALLILAVGGALVSPDPTIVRLAIFGIPAAGVVLAAILCEKGRKRTYPRIVLAIGAASYSIYLTHIFTQTVVRVACQKLGIPTAGIFEIPYALFGFALSVAVGIMTYHACEQPLCNYFTAMWDRRARRSGAAGEGEVSGSMGGAAVASPVRLSAPKD